ncbi:MAG: glycosyltransferase family 2 protein [Bacteroidota bacterium]
MIQISAVIITYNEEHNIGRCLDSLTGIVDDVVVVDSFSTDRTEGICVEKGARFIKHAFEGHIEQKNWALSQAIYPVVICLDADEALSERLRASVLDAKMNWAYTGYSMNRLTNYCGRWIRHSGWYPDRKLRLFDRRKGRWGGTNPHDKVELDLESNEGFLQGDLLHYSYYTVEEHFERARKYAYIAAQAKQSEGKRGWWMQVVFSPLAKFIRNYIIKFGFLDGREGLMIAYISALETYWKYKGLKKAIKQ